MNYDANPVRLLYNDEELKQRILMIIEGRDTITGCTFVNLCCQIAKMAFTEHKVKKADENTTIINEELAAEEKARMSCILWELIWEHKIVLLFGRSELPGLSNGEERFIKYSKSTPQSSEETTPEIPKGFSVNNINYKVLSNDDKTVEVVQSPNATGAVTIPSQVTCCGVQFTVVKIAQRAFERNAKLTSIVLPDTIKSIGANAFMGAKNTKALVLPKSLESAGEGAFNSSYITFVHLDLPSGLKEIKKWAFAGSTIATKKVRIPASVLSMEYGMFRGSVEKIEVNSGNPNYKSVDGVLFSKDGRTLIEYPNANSRVSYTVPTGVMTINDQAFCDCKNLKTITIPNTVKEIGMQALASCTSLSLLIVNATVPPTVSSSNTFINVPSNCSVQVPKGFASKYKAANGWKDFNIVEA